MSLLFAMAKSTTLSALLKVNELREAVPCQMAIPVILVVGNLTLNGIPLHAVLTSHLAKLGLDNVDQGSVAQVVVVDLSAEVLLTLGLELGVEASAATATSRLRSATTLG